MGAPEDRFSILVNGKPEDIAPGTTLARLIEGRGLDRRYLVVEHNGEPVSRDRFERVMLEAGDRLELVRPVAGG
jgi:thiamine biosynthesis protein ThiS